MDQIFHLRRRIESNSRLRQNWTYANRITDASGETLYEGVTPNGFFKSAVTFTDRNGHEALAFEANRPVMPGAFLTRDMSGRELFRIELPVAAKLRTKASMQLISSSNDTCFEIVPSHVATDNELTRLVAVLQEEFVVKSSGTSIGHTGQFDPESDHESLSASPAGQVAKTLLSDLAKIPGNILKSGKGNSPDHHGGQLSIASQHASPELALTLLIFRAYIYKELQSPQEAWWQGD